MFLNLSGDGGMDLGHLACLALDGIAEDNRRQAVFLCRLGSGLERHLRRGQHDGLGLVKDAVAGFRRFRFGLIEPVGHRAGQVDFIIAEDLFRPPEGRGIGYGRAGGDGFRVIARHIGDQERHHPRRMGGGGKLPALDRREVFAHRIHLADIGPGA